MNHALWKLYSDEEGSSDAGAQIQERLAWATRRCMESRERLGDDRFVDVWFQDALREPIAEITRAYGIFGIEMTSDARESIEKWRTDHPRNERPAHDYALADYGLTEDGIKEAFSAYRTHFIEPHQ